MSPVKITAFVGAICHKPDVSPTAHRYRKVQEDFKIFDLTGDLSDDEVKKVLASRDPAECRAPRAEMPPRHLDVAADVLDRGYPVVAVPHRHMLREHQEDQSHVAGWDAAHEPREVVARLMDHDQYKDQTDDQEEQEQKAHGRESPSWTV
jgi:hypothetical protein